MELCGILEKRKEQHFLDFQLLNSCGYSGRHSYFLVDTVSPPPQQTKFSKRYLSIQSFAFLHQMMDLFLGQLSLNLFPTETARNRHANYYYLQIQRANKVSTFTSEHPQKYQCSSVNVVITKKNVVSACFEQEKKKNCNV